MSFFDDEGDEPTRINRPARPRRPATAARPAGGAPDPHTARVRQLVALGFGALVLILFVVGIKGCLDSRRERALKDYNRNVASIVQSSDDQVAKPLFDILAGGGGGDAAADQQSALNQARTEADADIDRAEGLSVPDAMKTAHRSLLLVLNLRATGVARIAKELPAALSDQGGADEAISRIAGEMQAFLASDVVFSQRVGPLIKQALDEADVGGQSIPTSKFLANENLGWLDANQVADRINPGAGAAAKNGGVAPGLHGHGLIAVSVGGTALQPGATNRVKAPASLAFDVKFANQGDNDEENVTVTVTVKAAEAKPLTAKKKVAVTKTKTETTVSVPLGAAPPVGQATTVTVTVSAVRGEVKKDNNTQTYTVLFTR